MDGIGLAGRIGAWIRPFSARAVRRITEYSSGPLVKRGYSKAFTPRTERRVAITIDRVPPTLFDAAKAKAKREGVSLRALILGWLKAWVEKD